MKKPEIIYIPVTKDIGNWGHWNKKKVSTIDQAYISYDLVKPLIEHVELANDVVKKISKLMKT